MFDRSQAKRDALRDRQAVRLEKTAAGVAEIVKEAGFKSEMPDLIAQDNVGRFRERDARRKAFDKPDAVRKSGGLADLPCELDQAAFFNGIDSRGAGLAGQEPQDSGSTAQVYND